MKITSLLFFATLCASSASAHEHLPAGFLDTNGNNTADAGEPLRLVNAPSSGATFHMLMRPAGQRYAGYYSLDEQPRAAFPNDYFTFTALSDGQAELADPRHAATGSYIWMEITSVTGPAGGSFGFWDIDSDNPDLGWSYTHTTPTVSFLANEPAGGFKFVLSEPLDLPVGPGEDPYGHIHNRGFTTDTPGTYTIGFTLHDLSTNGPGDGSIHAPSQTYYLTFVAVPEPSTLALLVLAGVGAILFAHRRRAKARER
jgi:PEP-CTERM motif